MFSYFINPPPPPHPLKIWIMGWYGKCIVLSLLYMQRLHTESKPQKSGPLILSQTSNVATLMQYNFGRQFGSTWFYGREQNANKKFIKELARNLQIYKELLHWFFDNFNERIEKEPIVELFQFIDLQELLLCNRTGSLTFLRNMIIYYNQFLAFRA